MILNAKGIDEPPFKLSRSASKKEPGVRIPVLSPNGEPIDLIDVKLDAVEGSKVLATDKQGATLFEAAKWAKQVAFHVPVYDAAGGPFPLDAATMTSTSS